VDNESMLSYSIRARISRSYAIERVRVMQGRHGAGKEAISGMCWRCVCREEVLPIETRRRRNDGAQNRAPRRCVSIVFSSIVKDVRRRRAQRKAMRDHRRERCRSEMELQLYKTVVHGGADNWCLVYSTLRYQYSVSLVHLMSYIITRQLTSEMASLFRLRVEH